MPHHELQDSASEEIIDFLINGYMHAIELRDKESQGHAKRVATLTVDLARYFNLKEDMMINIYRGALLHDLGKIAIPDHILFKPGKLNPQEWKVMRTHPSVGFQLLISNRYLKPCVDIAHYHHERWDGSGYPYGLAQKEIPLVARIFMVVDVWDALNSDRPYRSAWSAEQAEQYIDHQAGIQFDPAIVNIFLQMLKSRKNTNSLQYSYL